MSILTCYMCSQRATSQEHAPPRCLFPQAEDTSDGVDYRKNLVTVPSCELHNGQKSHDDEYLLFVLAGSYTSSSVGLNQFLTKVHRAFKKRPGKAANFVRRATPVKLKRIGETEWENGAQVIIDGERVDGVLSNCARALYHHHTGSKFQGAAQVLTNFTMYLDEKVQASVSESFDSAANDLAAEPLLGTNPAVFAYKFKEDDETVLFYFCFYDSSAATVRFKKIILTH